ncbi:MAG: hypothetical protein HKN44_00565 [Ilumatobacter sp.]|nr:hypothetical protein [Ilumatobacter sp.]
MSPLSRGLGVPIALWVVGSTALIALSLRFEAGAIVAGLYVGLNGVSFFFTVYRRPPAAPSLLRAMAWCTAAQLPTMLVLLFDGASPREWGVESTESSLADRRRDPRPGREPPET